MVAVRESNSTPLGAAARLAIGTGVAGLSIEDRDIENARLYDKCTALERLRAARHSIDQSRENVLLVARTEILLDEPGALSAAIDKLVAFAEVPSRILWKFGVAISPMQ
ncbi:MAG: isocitrate lyase/phosphoenolpyruvate mutase family protein [Acetobacteraceae bacterium]|nr:isocitrate lyase/phosphoenolpyruvate mutase family protein [Acetobacteraceae bacterium]